MKTNYSDEQTELSVEKFLWLSLGEDIQINGLECDKEKLTLRTPSGFVVILKTGAHSFIFEQDKKQKVLPSGELEATDVFGQTYTLSVEYKGN